ncbi:hypothetical protein K7432_009117 [Basidiobolus ranarum]|uniref:Homeobox domain-containing protein n=1 Tax=Basidiobolus ranarum TaxID=34480 RepID=A0ABR2WQU4_9FUNG
MNTAENIDDSEQTYSYTVEDTGRGIKRRNRLNPQQTSRLMQIFEQTTKPRTEVRRTLAKELGMDPRAVQIWFQNRRQKVKKISQEYPMVEFQCSYNFVPSSPLEYIHPIHKVPSGYAYQPSAFDHCNKLFTSSFMNIPSVSLDNRAHTPPLESPADLVNPSQYSTLTDHRLTNHIELPFSHFSSTLSWPTYDPTELDRLQYLDASIRNGHSNHEETTLVENSNFLNIHSSQQALSNEYAHMVEALDTQLSTTLYSSLENSSDVSIRRFSENSQKYSDS